MVSRPVRVSSAPVGSSAKITFGRCVSARAIATRWASPPDSSPGRRRSLPARPSRESHWRPASMASLRPRPASSDGNATFSSAESSATSIPDWKTKPNSVRRSSLRFFSPRWSIRCPAR